MTPRGLHTVARSILAVIALGLALDGVGVGGPVQRLTPFLTARQISGPAVAQAARLEEPVDVVLSPAAQMTRLVNIDRAAHGLRAVSYDQALTAVARWRSEDMAVRQYFSHDIGAVPGLLVFDILRSQGISYRRAGENLADTYVAADAAAADAEAALMRSPTHRANILGADFTHLGVGAAVASSGRVVFTQLFKSAW